MYCIYDNGLYMAQTCAHLCHQRHHLLNDVGGNGESGESESGFLRFFGKYPAMDMCPLLPECHGLAMFFDQP